MAREAGQGSGRRGGGAARRPHATRIAWRDGTTTSVQTTTRKYLGTRRVDLDVTGRRLVVVVGCLARAGQA